MSRVKRYLPWIALVVVWILWGSTYLAIRVAVDTIPPYLMMGTRYLIAGLLLGGLQWAFASPKPSIPSRRELSRITITAVLLMVAGNGLLCLAETRVPSGIAALLFSSVPIWMMVLEALRSRTMLNWTSVVGLIVGSIGMVLLVGEQSGATNAFFAGLIVVASLAWGFGSIYARGTQPHHKFAVPLEMMIGGTIAVLVGLVLGEASHFSFASVSVQSLGGMLWLITGGAMAGYTAYAYIVRTLPPSTVATFAYINPIVAVILGAIVLHEPIAWNVVVGGVALIASVVVILLGKSAAGDPVRLTEGDVA